MPQTTQGTLQFLAGHAAVPQAQASTQPFANTGARAWQDRRDLQRRARTALSPLCNAGAEFIKTQNGPRLTWIKSAAAILATIFPLQQGGSKMKKALASFAGLLAIGGVAATTSEPAHAVVYCTYIGYPANCVARPGVVLRARPVARAATVGAATVGVGAPGVGVRRGTPANRGGPVNRAGRR